MPSALVTRFFQLINNKKFAEAERELERYKQRIPNNEWNKGYIQALKGMLISRRANGDNYSLLSNTNLEDHKLLRKYRKEFLRHVNNGLHADYDRGYFSAWADYVGLLIRMQKKRKDQNDPPPQAEKSGEEQLRLEHFVKERQKA